MEFYREYYEQSEIWEGNFQQIPTERERISATIGLIPPDVRSILDVGCGNGVFLNVLSDCSRKIGVDFSFEALRHVKGTKILGTGDSLPFQPMSFDLVTCLEVLEHLPHGVFEKTLEELERVSKKYILISVPNKEILSLSMISCPYCRCRFHPSRHVRSFSVESLLSLFNGFRLVQWNTVGPLEQRIRLLVLVYLLIAPLPWSSTMICPQCGYQTKDLSAPSVGGRNRLKWALDLISKVAKVMPGRAHRWLLALYMRG